MKVRAQSSENDEGGAGEEPRKAKQHVTVLAIALKKKKAEPGWDEVRKPWLVHARKWRGGTSGLHLCAAKWGGRPEIGLNSIFHINCRPQISNCYYISTVKSATFVMHTWRLRSAHAASLVRGCVLVCESRAYCARASSAQSCCSQGAGGGQPHELLDWNEKRGKCHICCCGRFTLTAFHFYFYFFLEGNVLSAVAHGQPWIYSWPDDTQSFDCQPVSNPESRGQRRSLTLHLRKPLSTCEDIWIQIKRQTKERKKRLYKLTHLSWGKF